MQVEHHVAGEKAHYGTGMGCQIIKEMITVLRSFFGGLALVARHVTETNTKGAVDGTGIVQ